MYTSCDKTAIHLSDCETDEVNCSTYYNNVSPLIAELDEILEDMRQYVSLGAMPSYRAIINNLNYYKQELEEIR